MEKTIKMFSYNIDNVKIIKDIPENLYSHYKNIGWKDYKQIPINKNQQKTNNVKEIKNKKEINE